MNWVLHLGSALDVLVSLPADSVQCCVTSPPYFGLRDYKADGQIGVEKTPELYIASLVSIFAQVRRVLKDDGVLWVNLGDSHNAYNGGAGPGSKLSGNQTKQRPKLPSGYGLQVKSLKPKDLIGTPWMLAFALRADGWYLRSDTIWSKLNCMPESVKDRPTRAHEYVFLLSKSRSYFYDAAAIRKPASEAMLLQMRQGYDGQGTKDYAANGVQNPSDLKRRIIDKQRGHSRRHQGFNDRWDQLSREQQVAVGANARSVWSISPEPSSLPHFAMMPKALARRCILSGSRPGDAVLDPFAGMATTGVVALEEGRDFVGIELSAEYHGHAKERLANTMPMLAREAEPTTTRQPSLDYEPGVLCD